jgi:hypothetical protein
MTQDVKTNPAKPTSSAARVSHGLTGRRRRRAAGYRPGADLYVPRRSPRTLRSQTWGNWVATGPIVDEAARQERRETRADERKFRPRLTKAQRRAGFGQWEAA